MSDVDALRDRLIAERLTAQTAEILAAVARVEYYNRQYNASARTVDALTCPPALAALTPAALADWAPRTLLEVRGEVVSRLADSLLAAPDPGPLAAWPPPGDWPPALLDALDPARGARAVFALAVAWLNGEAPGAVGVAWLMVRVHTAWKVAGDGARHPLAPLVAAWQRRPPALDGATVTVTGNRTNMTRRAQLAATVRRVPWRLDAEVSGAVVDGEPMAAALPDPAGLFPVRTRRPRRRFQPGEQRTLNLPRVPALQPDLRLLALHDVSADPNSSPVLPGDVLELLTFAHLADRPLILTEREGAALLVRDRKGKPRHVQRQHDMPRFWQAAATLRSVLLFDPAGSGRWVDLATVEVPRVNPVDRVTIGPPAWARGQRIGKWTLTAEGSAAALARVTVGKQGLAGRVVTGLEYRIASGYSGKSGTVAPDLRPANARCKAGPGAPVFVTWRHVLRYAGDWWDETDPAQDKAALVRYRRAMATLERRDYFVGASPGAEAPAGDSVEIVNRVTAGGRGRPGGLMVRASARFVEAARLAQLPQGAGFERMMLTDYAGLGTLPTE